MHVMAMQVRHPHSSSGGYSSGGGGEGSLGGSSGGEAGPPSNGSGGGEPRHRLSDQQRQIQHLIKDQLVQRGLLGRSNPQGAALFHTLQSVATMGAVPTSGTSPPQGFSPPQGYSSPQGYSPTQAYSPPQGFSPLLGPGFGGGSGSGFGPGPRAASPLRQLPQGRISGGGLSQHELYAKQKQAIATELAARQARTSGGAGVGAKGKGKRGWEDGEALMEGTGAGFGWGAAAPAPATAPAPSKAAADQRLGERLRRARMKEFISELMRLVPGAEGEPSRDRVLDRVIEYISQLRQDIYMEEKEEKELEVDDMTDAAEVPLSSAIGEDESQVDHLVGTVEVKVLPDVHQNADNDEVRQMYVRVCAKTRQGLLAHVVRALSSDWNIVSADIKTIDDSAYDIFLLETTDLTTPVHVLKDALYVQMHSAALSTSMKRQRCVDPSKPVA